MATQENRSMVSETSICNQALSWVGANPIDNLEERTTEAEWCRDNYPFIRDAVLEDALWTFATIKHLSGPVADMDNWGQYFIHAMPNDWIKVFMVFDNPQHYINDLEQADWEMNADRQCLVNCSTAYMIGVRRVVDTGKYTPLFVQALAARLAVDMAIPFAENPQLQKDMQALYNSKVFQASNSDAQQARRRKIQKGKMSRRIHSGGRY